jgi:hypothetical protein
MHRSPDAWRRIVAAFGVTGLVLVAIGYWALHEGPRDWHTQGLLAFYGGLALAIAAIVIWYRFVPPRPPAPEDPEPEHFDDSDADEAES